MPEQWTYIRNKNGTVESIKPLPYYGWKAKLESKLRRRGFNRMANILAWWDERGLGK